MEEKKDLSTRKRNYLRCECCERIINKKNSYGSTKFCINCSYHHKTESAEIARIKSENIYVKTRIEILKSENQELKNASK
jgi:hypothetical protein